MWSQSHVCQDSNRFVRLVLGARECWECLISAGSHNHEHGLHAHIRREYMYKPYVYYE